MIKNPALPFTKIPKTKRIVKTVCENGRLNNHMCKSFPKKRDRRHFIHTGTVLL